MGVASQGQHEGQRPPLSGGVQLVTEPDARYHVVKKQPANVTCEAYGATRITFTCAGSVIPAASQRTYETWDEARGATLVRSSVQVSRSDLANHKESREHQEEEEEGDQEGEEFWCQCSAQDEGSGVSVTSRRAIIELSCEWWCVCVQK